MIPPAKKNGNFTKVIAAKALFPVFGSNKTVFVSGKPVLVTSAKFFYRIKINQL